jgi:1-acyl-sn-glycerol-3-phosphate acyltransferase
MKHAHDPGGPGQPRAKALKAVVAATRAETRAQSPPAHHLSRGHEASRPATSRKYKYGIVEIYAPARQLPVVPVAHHVAGLYWPRRKFLRFPGTIKARFLPPIPPGLDEGGIHAAA